MAEAHRVPFLPREWRHTLSAPLEEDAPADYLTNIDFYLTADHLLPQKDLQALCYLVIYPPEVAITANSFSSDTITHSALDLLDRYLLYHSPSRFASELPCYPLEVEDRENPRWLQWTAGNQTREQHFRSTMRLCLETGIWGLVWETGSKLDKGRQGKKGAGGQDHDDEETAPVVSENGWVLLGWLVRKWKKDREEHKHAVDGGAYSPAFVRQLPGRPGKPRRTDCDAVFHVLRSAFPSVTSPTPIDWMGRASIAIDLLLFVVDLTQTVPQILSWDKLASETVLFFKDLPSPCLDALLSVLAPDIPLSYATTTCGLLVEVLANRSQHYASLRSQQRRAIQAKQDVPEHDRLVQPRTLGFEPPTVQHILTLLTLPPQLAVATSEPDKAARNNKAAQMAVAKLFLALSMHPLRQPTTHTQWRDAFIRSGEGWRDEVRKSFDAGVGVLDASTLATVNNAERLVLDVLEQAARPASAPGGGTNEHEGE